jgi:diguanylate cyclase
MTAPVRAGSTARTSIVVALVAGSMAYVTYLAVAPGTAWSVTVANDITQTLVPLAIAAPALFLAAWRSHGRRRASWLLLAAAAVSWGLGQLVWTWFEVVREEVVPYPGWADLGYLACVPLLVAGVVVFPSSSLRSIGRARAVVDGLIAAGAALYASYGTFLGSVYGTHDGPILDRLIAVTYPAADIVAITVILAVLARRSRRMTGPLPIVAMGMVSLAVADLAFAFLTAHGTYGNDPVTDLGWPLGFALLAAAPWLGAEPTGAALPTSQRSLLSVILPYLPLVPGLLVFAYRSTTGQPFGTFLGVTGAVLAVLLVSRQVVTVLENRELTGHLEQTVSELRERERRLEHQAFHDPLTALANRALFCDRLDHALAQRRPGPIAVLFADIDDFKVVNDTLGHDAGDQVLVSVGERLRACVRAGDTVARLGGDEFAVLLEGEDATRDGLVLADRVLDAFDVPYPVNGRDLSLGVSLGLADGCYRPGDPVLEDADLAMYAAKGAGKARLVRYEPSMRLDAMSRLGGHSPDAHLTIVPPTRDAG